MDLCGWNMNTKTYQTIGSNERSNDNFARNCKISVRAPPPPALNLTSSIHPPPYPRKQPNFNDSQMTNTHTSNSNLYHTPNTRTIKRKGSFIN